MQIASGLKKVSSFNYIVIFIEIDKLPTFRLISKAVSRKCFRIRTGDKTISSHVDLWFSDCKIDYKSTVWTPDNLVSCRVTI